jgi:hypothetical protein
MAKFKVVLERVEMIIHQGAVMVQAGSAEEASRIILADLEVDQGSYDDELEPIESGIGDMVVTTMEDHHEPHALPRAMAG